MMLATTNRMLTIQQIATTISAETDTAFKIPLDKNEMSMTHKFTIHLAVRKMVSLDVQVMESYPVFFNRENYFLIQIEAKWIESVLGGFARIFTV